MKFFIGKEWFSVLLAVCIAVFLSISLFTPHTIGRGDQRFYLPEIQKQLNDDKNLYSDKDLFNFENPARYTLYTNIIEKISRAIDKNGGNGIYYSLLILAVISRAILFIAVYLLLRYLTGNHVFSLLAIFLFMPGNVIDHDTFAVVPRTIGFPIGLLAVALTLTGRPLIGAIALAVSIPIHVVTAIPFALIYAVLAGWNLYKRKFTKKEFFLGLTILAAGSLLYLIFFSGNGISMFEKLSEDWRSFFLAVSPWFFQRFDFSLLSQIFLSCIMFVPAYKIFKSIQLMAERRIEMLVILFVTIIVGSLEIITIITEIQSLMLFEFFRAFRITKFLAYLAVIAGLFYLLQNREKFSKKFFFFYVSGLAFFILSFSTGSYILSLPFFLYCIVELYKESLSKKQLTIYAIAILVSSLGFLAYLLAVSENFYNICTIYDLIVSLLFSYAIFSNSLFKNLLWLVPSLAFALFIVILLFVKGVEAWSWGQIYNFPMAIFGPLALILLAFVVNNNGSNSNFINFRLLASVFILYFLAGGAFIVYARPEEPPWQRHDAINEMCQWIKSTPPGSLFLFEPFFEAGGKGDKLLLTRQYDFVRIGCKRSVFYRYADRNFGHFNKEAALEFIRRKKAIEEVSKDINSLEKFLAKEKIDYVMSTKELLVDLPVVFKNDEAIIYARK